MKPRFPTDSGGEKRDPLRLANEALDGDVSFDEAIASGGVDHIRQVRRVERLLSIEKNAGTPDLTQTVLGDVGARRGWLDSRSRAMVWGGRGLIAATLLGALAVTLTVRRAAPEFGPHAREAAALAQVVDVGERAAAGATAPLATVVETIETGRPILASLTSTLEAPTPKSRVCERERFPERRLVVEVALDPASQRAVDAVCQDSQSPRWLRVVRTGHAAHEHD